MDLERIRHLESLPETEAAARIRALQARYGEDLCLLAHLYQRAPCRVYEKRSTSGTR